MTLSKARVGKPTICINNLASYYIRWRIFNVMSFRNSESMFLPYYQIIKIQSPSSKFLIEDYLSHSAVIYVNLNFVNGLSLNSTLILGLQAIDKVQVHIHDSL